MLPLLETIFSTMEIENPKHEYVKLHSHTSKEQGLFLQEIFDLVKPSTSLEVGLAFGISSLFILEKHREYEHQAKAHLIIEPFPWDGVAEYNIEKAELIKYTDIRYLKSHDILPKLYYEQHRIQYAYIDTLKKFDTVLQDFYFIDKILDVNGVIIFDDCDGGWLGIQRVARFVNTLPHYKVLAAHNKTKLTIKKKIAVSVLKFVINILPFKKRFYSTLNFKTDAELGLDYRCIAFQKTGEDERKWDWDKTF